MTAEVVITRHARQRMRERLGLPKRAVQRHAQRAYDEGLHHGGVSGAAGRYLDALYFKNRCANDLRVYGEFVFVFANGVLITVHEIPNRLKGAFLNES